MASVFQNFKLFYDVGDFTELRDLWQRPKHLSSYNRLYAIRSGEATFTIDDQIIDLKPNCTYLFPSGRMTSYRFTQDASLDWVHFDARLYGNLNLFDYLNCPLNLPTPMDSLSRHLFKRLFDLQKNNFSEAPYETPAILQILLAPFLARGEMSHEADALARLSPVFEYIEKNLTIAPRTAELAALLKLEQNYFIDLFSKTVGIPPAKFINKRRMEIASTFIMTGLPLTEVAQKLGYYDSPHFCRVFKKSQGLNPSQYKTQFDQELKGLSSS
ncbi:AraC family transcriptional regulator [Lentisphaera profundi]|uniref:AraC family transcriptional regulator n=1 Tax=Lentisphaera profundi TaxID=1658616 RepID=A0ABY7VWC2_9BACT|nr:AraC family transcriptional regulator [Lentisphaera profundi]WDE97568.1 AraC family transcriptional regulator [Lentisphaera profundi]